MTKLTLARFKRDLRSALDAKGLTDVEIVSAHWIGERCRELTGTTHFRVGRASVRVSDGRTALVQGSIDTQGGWRFATVRS